MLLNHFILSETSRGPRDSILYYHQLPKAAHGHAQDLAKRQNLVSVVVWTQLYLVTDVIYHRTLSSSISILNKDRRLEVLGCWITLLRR